MQDIGLIVHVFLGTLGFGAAIAFEVLLLAVTRVGNPETTRAAYRAAQRFRPLIGACLLVAILLGFVIAIQRGLPLTSPWLLVTYGCLVISGAVYGGIVQRRARVILAGGNADPKPSASPLAAIALTAVMFVILGAMIR